MVRYFRKNREWKPIKRKCPDCGFETIDDVNASVDHRYETKHGRWEFIREMKK